VTELTYLLAGGIIGYLIGYAVRDFKVYWDGERKARNILREYQERRELERAGICPKCHGPIATRNPTGLCDHLYYPDNVK
jgi:hypothetical protein